MPTVLLPASAAAFAPRSAPNIVLGNKVEPWLTASLKRINRVKRPLNSVPQHLRCLTETLSSASAIWSLCSIMLPKAPESELRKDSNPLIEALFNYQLLHVEAYVVHVDMVLSNEVAFKLTKETIESLVEYHKDIWSVDISAKSWDWSEKEAQLKKLQEEFVQAANKFVYRTAATALEGLEDDGAGELLSGRSEEVKTAVMGLFLPLLPPPPRVVDVVQPPPLLPSSPATSDWWQPSIPAQHQPAPVESWRVLSSSPSPTTTAESTSSMWAAMAHEMQLPSPTPSYSQPAFCQPFSSAASSQYYSTPLTTVAMSPLPLPSMLASQCGAGSSYNNFSMAWPQYHDYTTIM